MMLGAFPTNVIQGHMLVLVAVSSASKATFDEIVSISPWFGSLVTCLIPEPLGSVNGPLRLGHWTVGTTHVNMPLSPSRMLVMALDES